MKYDVHFSKYLGEHEMLKDVWKWQVVEAENENDAADIIVKEHNRDGKKINYFLSCSPID